MPYAQEWKDTRRAFSKHFRQTAAGQFRTVEIKHTRALLLDLVERPEDFYDLIRLYVVIRTCASDTAILKICVESPARL